MQADDVPYRCSKTYLTEWVTTSCSSFKCFLCQKVMFMIKNRTGMFFVCTDLHWCREIEWMWLRPDQMWARRHDSSTCFIHAVTIENFWVSVKMISYSTIMIDISVLVVWYTCNHPNTIDKTDRKISKYNCLQCFDTVYCTLHRETSQWNIHLPRPANVPFGKRFGDPAWLAISVKISTG